MLRTAIGHHRAGRVAEAESVYRQILAIDARHADSLHLLGMIAYQGGRSEAAIAMIQKAIAIDKTKAAYHSNLGTVFHAQGRLDEAAQCYQRAVTLQPDLATAHYNLGNVFHAQLNLEEAATCYERALLLEPTLAEAHYNLGNVLQANGNLEDAVACYKQALAIEPGKYEALHNLGNAFQSQAKLKDAMACYEQALNIQPDYAKAHFSLGSVFHALGDIEEALGRYRTALALEPDFAEAAFAESLVQLLRGEFADGWRKYEWRWQTKEHTPPMRAYAQPLWKGEKLAAGRLLIWGEQGVGDEVMFAGLIPDAVRTGNPCVIDCDARLRPLFARSFPDVEVVSSRSTGRICGDDPMRRQELAITAHAPSGSLPGLFRASPSAFANTTSPYLRADAAARASFRERYDDGRRLVGLTWNTNNPKTGRTRSIDLTVFAPLFARSDIRWISLQYGDPSWLENQGAAARVLLVIDRSVDQFRDIDDFAAQISAIDLVITIDNSTAHLAGALGIPTWVLLPLAADWRWLQSREDSPWYPSVRLFRQRRIGDWQSVIEEVQGALESERS